VPLTLEVNGKHSSLLLREEEKVVEFDSGINSVKLNINRSGFYRVHYQDHTLLAPMNNLEKGGLVDDYYNLLLSRRVGFEEYERVMRVFLNEHKDYLPVWEVSKQLWELYTIKPDKYGALARDAHARLLRLWRSSHGEMAKLTRSIIAERLARLDENYALGLASFYEEYERVPQELRQAVVYAYARANADFDGLLQKYKETVDPEEKIRFLRGLASIRSEESFNRLLELVVNGTLKARDGALVIGATAANPEQRLGSTQGAPRPPYELFEEYAERLTGHRWAAARILSDPLSREGANRPREVEEIVRKMRRKETERDAREILELMQVYSKL